MSTSINDSTRVKVCIAGAGGRMGRRVLAMLHSHSRLVAGTLLERAGVQLDADTAAGALCTDDVAAALVDVKVMIDFSAPSAVVKLAAACAEHGVAYLAASTGLATADEQALHAAAKRVAVFQTANLSLGVNVLLELVENASRRLRAFDVEIGEIHHRHKKDAPSGTALALGKAVERGRGPLHAVEGRHGVGDPRASDELGYAALRGGEVAGEHTVYLFGDNERLELTHRATSPDIFAHGALLAATWLLNRQPGRYTMRDVLDSTGD